MSRKVPTSRSSSSRKQNIMSTELLTDLGLTKMDTKKLLMLQEKAQHETRYLLENITIQVVDQKYDHLEVVYGDEMDELLQELRIDGYNWQSSAVTTPFREYNNCVKVKFGKGSESLKEFCRNLKCGDSLTVSVMLKTYVMPSVRKTGFYFVLASAGLVENKKCKKRKRRSQFIDDEAEEADGDEEEEVEDAKEEAFINDSYILTKNQK